MYYANSIIITIVWAEKLLHATVIELPSNYPFQSYRDRLQQCHKSFALMRGICTIIKITNVYVFLPHRPLP